MNQFAAVVLISAGIFSGSAFNSSFADDYFPNDSSPVEAQDSTNLISADVQEVDSGPAEPFRKNFDMISTSQAAPAHPGSDNGTKPGQHDIMQGGEPLSMPSFHDAE